jgi:hypothetical protein
MLDNVNLLAGNINIIETLTDASKEVGLKVIVEQTEYYVCVL